MTGIKLAVDIGNNSTATTNGYGELIGAEIGAKTLSYVYHQQIDDDDMQCVEANSSANSKDRNKNTTTQTFIADTGTAGSIALLLQAAFLPALVRSMKESTHDNNNPKPIKIEMRGGTNASNAPQIDYITDVFAPFINSYFHQRGNGFSNEPPLEISISKRGYYPKGGGVVNVTCNPIISSAFSFTSTTINNSSIKFPPINLTKCPPITSITIKAFHAGTCPSWVAEKMVSGALKELKLAWRENIHFRRRFQHVGNNLQGMSPTITNPNVQITHETNCVGSGSGILIVAHPNNKPYQTLPYPSLAASGLGDRKVPSNQTGSNAARELVDSIASGGCVDRWLQDQLIPFMALADGESQVLVGELTSHTKTAMKVAEQMTGCEFHVEGIDGASNVNEQQQEGGYGESGSTPGRHIIRCHGIGFSYT